MLWLTDPAKNQILYVSPAYNRGAMQIVPVASAGVDDGFLELVRGRLSLLDDAPAGHGIAPGRFLPILEEPPTGDES